MPQLIESHEIAAEIELIISQAGHDILIASPVIHLTESLFIKLAEASVRGVKIKILCGTVPDPAATRLLSVLKNLALICAENMNARCYFNESRVLITSMGLDDMLNTMAVNTGFLLTADNDNELYGTIRRVIETVSGNGIQILLEPGSDEHKITSDAIYRGFCVGCGMPVTFNPARPYCNMCRNIFASDAHDTPGNFCHSCGCESPVTITQTLCIKCRAS